MINEEKKFKELCDYVKREIMGYDENQKLSSYMVLRLRGIKDGKFIANKKTASMANYSYDVILLTFKYIKHHGLDDIIKTKTFHDEKHKFNYIMMIVSDNINNVYNKVKQIKEQQKRADNIEVVELPNYENKYKNVKIRKDLESFW